MRRYLFVLFCIPVACIYSQSYVDSATELYLKGEYQEALKEFRKAYGLKNVLTDASIGKMYYYRGLTWFAIAENSGAVLEEGSAFTYAYDDLKEVKKYTSKFDRELEEINQRLSYVILNQAEELLKEGKKADNLDESLILLNKRVELLTIVKEFEISSFVTRYLAETNKYAGDLIFKKATDVESMKKAQEYYKVAIQQFEIARYDDPFDKGVIKTILELARKLDDAERVKEYTQLLEIAGG